MLSMTERHSALSKMAAGTGMATQWDGKKSHFNYRKNG